MKNARRFFEAYSTQTDRKGSPIVLDVGSQDINGSLRQVAPAEFKYIGVDFAAGNGVDLVLEDPYKLPFESESIDIVLSSSCFEHAEMFWLSYLEALRVLKPTGLLYLNAPSNGAYHRYPVDCWRFYPDAGRALVAWARKNGLRPTLLESFIGLQDADIWNDFVAVFLKDDQFAHLYPDRMVNHFEGFENGLLLGSEEILRYQHHVEDRRRITTGANAGGAELASSASRPGWPSQGRLERSLARIGRKIDRLWAKG